MIKNIAQALADPRIMRAAARKLATEGVHGDTILAHINPEEAALLRAHGGAGTPNARTGLPQFAEDTGTGANSGAGNAGVGVEGQGATDFGPAVDHTEFDKAALGRAAAMKDALDIQGANTYGVNRGAAVAREEEPSISDKVADFFGQGQGNVGFLGSNAALSGVSMAAGMLGGPPASAAAAGLMGMVQGRGPAASLGAALGGGLGFGASTGASALNSMARNGDTSDPGPGRGQAGPGGGDQSGASGGDQSYMGMPSTPLGSPDSSNQTAALIKALGPEGQLIAQDPTRMAALLQQLRNRSPSIGQQQFYGTSP